MDPRPLTATDFDKKLAAFRLFINEATYKSTDCSPEERRAKILTSLRFERFSAVVHQIFQTEMDLHCLKCLYKKVCLNPDYEIEWSEVSLHRQRAHLTTLHYI